MVQSQSCRFSIISTYRVIHEPIHIQLDKVLPQVKPETYQHNSDISRTPKESDIPRISSLSVISNNICYIRLSLVSTGIIVCPQSVLYTTHTVCPQLVLEYQYVPGQYQNKSLSYVCNSYAVMITLVVIANPKLSNHFITQLHLLHVLYTIQGNTILYGC